MSNISTVRAKLSVTQVKADEYGETVYFYAIYSNNPEDNSFAAATPSASMVMTVNNPAVKGFFQAGKSYYFNITPVQDGEVSV